tara:strand:+ start:7013 stop:7732 length:720 start_codon:yes stop_codon:yes gene_type:complete
MPTVIHGSNGVSVGNGTAAAPTVKGQDSDSGLFFGADTLDLSTGGTARIGIASGNTTVTGNLTTTGSISAGSFTGLSGLYNAWAQLVHTSASSYQVASEDWTNRPLTNEQDPSNIVTLDGTTGRFSLGAGSYRISWAESFFDTADVVDRLTTYADGTYTNVDDLFSIGMAQFANPTDPTGVLIVGATRVTHTGTKTYALRHHVDDNAVNTSGGRNNGLSKDASDNNVNVFAKIEIFREA